MIYNKLRTLEEIENYEKGRWLVEKFRFMYDDFVKETMGEDEVWVSSDLAACFTAIGKLKFLVDDNPHFVGRLVDTGQSLFIAA